MPRKPCFSYLFAHFPAADPQLRIWTDGIIGKDITDAHIDFYARFTSPGVVVAARENDATIYDSWWEVPSGPFLVQGTLIKHPIPKQGYTLVIL